MILRNLGKSGLRVSLVGLGCNNFGQRMDLESSTRVIHKALDCGITLFDTADVYGGRGGSETVLGQVLGGLCGLDVRPRPFEPAEVRFLEEMAAETVRRLEARAVGA